MPKANSGAAAATARLTYAVELARGSSHISSTLTPETERRAIVETVAEFCELYGETNLPLFQKLLAEEVQQRGKNEAALAVAQFKFACNCSLR
ncbi:hypothetical protein LMG28727_02174 [Paraburkholderia kirstenboschensis]|uniref:hypothetical protein n=1 Tax=Paraburkholderia kirstenboschensis TaxID=1245436 RepID=UPI000A94FA75|nr:hypothetical protein [Paraburkholderia kirstenboschensis]CAD6526599.1 hypothetical protein LMG28727_02174 [Paraburkholderia kirstenboschensis]